MDYKGVIFEESLKKNDILQEVTILSTRKEKVTEKHQTPWLTQWTLHTVNIPEEKMDAIATELCSLIDDSHQSSWYIDCKNDTYHYIIFKDKIFKVDLKNPYLYKDARNYGASLGIPLYQMTFERLKR